VINRPPQTDSIHINICYQYITVVLLDRGFSHMRKNIYCVLCRSSFCKYFIYTWCWRFI